MLGRLRSRVSGLFEALASKLAVLPANLYTLLGVAVAALAPAAALAYGPLTTAVVVAASGLLDALDGAVARVRGEASPAGAFLDSVTDRVSDTFYAAAFLALDYSPWLVLAFLSGALITSYARARYESLTGHSMEGIGLLERSDRIAAQTIVLLVHAATGMRIAEALYALLAAASWATVLERLVRGLRTLGRSKAG